MAQQVLPAPRGLTITNVPGDAGSQQLRLQWEPVPGATGYEVFQWRKNTWWLNEDDPNRTPLTTSTVIQGLDSGSAYEFCVKAIGEGGKSSAYSASAGGRTGQAGQVNMTSKPADSGPTRFSIKPGLKGPAPEAPTGIIGVFSEQDRIRISWRAVPGVTRYSVEQEKDGTWAPAQNVVGDVASTSVILIDRPQPGPYKLRVRSVNREGTLSEPSWAITVER